MNTSATARIILLLQAITLSSHMQLARAESLQDAGYEVDGTAQWTYHFPDGSHAHQERVEFTLSARHGQWWMRHYLRSAPPEMDTVAAYDGTRLYVIHRLGRPSASSLASDPKNRVANVANASLFDSEIPHVQFSPELGPVWLAFASRAYFTRLQTNRVEPPIASDGVGSEYTGVSPRQLEAIWELFDDGQGLPSRVVYLDPGGQRNIPPVYAGGFTNCMYSVAETSRIHGMTIPNVATLTVFTPKVDGRSSSELNVLALCEIRMTAARSSSSRASFTPDVPGITSVQDSRVPGFYFVTNHWRSAEAVLADPTYRKMQTNFTADPPGLRRLRSFYSGTRLVFIVGVLGVLATWAFFSLRRSN